MQNFRLISIFLFLILFQQIFSAKNDSIADSKAFNLSVSYTGDMLWNAAGGIEQKIACLGMANLELSFDTEKARWWKGGTFFAKTTNTHGKMPSAEFIGDLQVASNIEAGNHTFFQELWYKQSARNVSFTLGLQDLNAEIAVTEFGSLFLNSSFGVIPNIAYNMPSPIFPLTSFGLTFNWEINENFRWITAVYDGEPTDFKYNAFNLNWKFHKQDGIIALSEIQFREKNDQNPGTYKSGIYNHNHFFSKYHSASDSLKHTIWGVFAHADKVVWKRANQSLGIFAQSGYDFSRENMCKFYVGGGINFSGLAKNDGSDILGLAVAHAKSNSVNYNETTVELTYRLPINQYIYIQPDIQYIINPSGTGEKLPDSLVGIIRFGATI